jgi:hypothetical protein
MGKWATYRKRGGGGQPVTDVAELPTVELSLADPTNLAWVLSSGPDPTNWRIFLDLTVVDIVPGVDRGYDTSGTSGSWTVQGFDGVGNPTTQMSNAVVL